METAKTKQISDVAAFAESLSVATIQAMDLQSLLFKTRCVSAFELGSRYDALQEENASLKKLVAAGAAGLKHPQISTLTELCARAFPELVEQRAKNLMEQTARATSVPANQGEQTV